MQHVNTLVQANGIAYARNIILAMDVIAKRSRTVTFSMVGVLAMQRALMVDLQRTIAPAMLASLVTARCAMLF
jgi:hypothetical protein